MAAEFRSLLPELLSNSKTKILEEWLKEQLSAETLRPDLMQNTELRRQSGEILNLLTEAATSSNTDDIRNPVWSRVRDMLGDISRSRAVQGYSSNETATFVFSLKQPLLNSLREMVDNDLDLYASNVWYISRLIDKLGLYTTDVFIKSKEEIIARQQIEMIELSTPVVQLWNGILALPLIGTLDSARTQVVMENLLTKIVETGSFVAIIDITGVPMVDTLVAQHLLKTVAAARLMGADCIISGIRPQIAQTIVHLGVNLEEVVTKATMADAFKLALSQNGLMVTKANAKTV